MNNPFKVFTRQPIFFVYADTARYSGTTVMRGEQLAQMAKRVLPNPDRISFVSSDYRFPRHAVLFLTKEAMKFLKPPELDALKKNKNTLIFDPVDEALPAHSSQYSDTIVAASKTAYASYKKSFPAKRIVLVNHHIDPRLKKIDFSQVPDSFRAGYFGEPMNTVITPKIEKLVDFVTVSTGTQDSSWINKLPSYNFHYAIRKIHPLNAFKPFLKGFTAAYCGANILIQASEEEAVGWLGKDYPYLLNGRVTESGIIQALEWARESYGSAEWKRGIEIMREIAEITSDQAVSRQLAELFI